MAQEKHLFVDLAEVVRHHAANVKQVGAKIESLVQSYSKTGPNMRQFKVWLGKLRKAYAAGLIETPTRGRPRENEFVEGTVRSAYTVKDLENEAGYLVKVLSRAQDKDNWQAAFDVTDMHVRGARRSLEMIAERLEAAAKDLMPERFRFGKFTLVDNFAISRRQAKPWFEAIIRASRLLEQRGFDYLLYGDLVFTMSNSWGGLYQPQGDSVHLDLGSRPSTKRLTDVLVHELGHRLWFKFLDGGARDRFASPWISRDEATRRVWEQYRDVFTMPPDEPREAFELVWKTQYDFKQFQRWIRESPGKLARWMQYASDLYTGPEPGHEVIRNGKLNREAFDHARQKVQRWSEQSDDIDVREGNAQSLERFRVRQERVWRNANYRGRMLTYKEVEDMLEPHGSEFHVNPRAKKGGVLRKLLEIKPVDFSVTRYGNMNRREDFAEIFTEVLLGRNKDRSVQQRLQSVLPKGRVMSAAEPEIADRTTVNLQREYDEWNRRLWNGKLPKVPLKWVQSKQVGGRVVSHGVRDDPSTWTIKRLEISDFMELPYRHFLGLLVHEMVHVHLIANGVVDRGGQHGLRFMDELNRVRKLVPFDVPVTEDITKQKVSKQVAVKPVGVVLFGKRGAIQVYAEAAIQQVMSDMAKLPADWLERQQLEFYVVSDPELAKYPVKRKFSKGKVSFYPVDADQIARIRQGRRIGSLPVTARLELPARGVIREAMQRRSDEIARSELDRACRRSDTAHPVKNPDPKARAFWQFVDRAAAQVDTWPDWMLHRDVMAAVGEDWYGPNGQRYRIVEDTGDGWRVEIQHKSSDLPAEESWTFSKQQFERMKESLPLSPVATAEAPAMPFKVGDLVRHGKYKNKIAKIIRFGVNDKGQTTVLLEPVPKGRKKTKELGLFKIWTTPDAVEAVAASSFDRVLSPSTSKKLRADFLMLMKNIKKLKTYRQTLQWHEAVQRWGQKLEHYIESAATELGRMTSSGLPRNFVEMWQQSLKSAVYPLIFDVQSTGFDRYELATRYTYREHKRAEVEDLLVRDFHEQSATYERRVKRVAREAWKNLDAAIAAIQASLEERGITGLDVPQDERIDIEGFSVTLTNLSSRGYYKPKDAVDNLKRSLAHYKKRAAAVFPWLLRYRLPIVLDGKLSLDDAAHYEPADKTIWMRAAAEKPERIAHVLAHEMAHHVWRQVLSKQQQEYWEAAIKGSRGPLDLREVMKLGSFSGLSEDLIRKDPILALRIQTFIHDPRFKHHDLSTKEGLERYLQTNEPVVQVTTEPITGYAAKNSEEAFCEAFGLLVGYGPRTVLPIVRQRMQTMLPQMKVQANVTAATDELYHTTSLQALAKILQSRTFKSRGFDTPFISFSEKPVFGDIRGNDAVIVLDQAAVRNRLMPVEYSERWYERFPEHAAYVAGEGWREQYEEPDDCYDEEGWADEDCVEQAYREAELQAFLDKSDEREWLSRAAGDLRLPADAFKRVVCSKAKLAVVEALLKKLRLKMPVKVLRDRSTGRVEDLGAEQAGPERDKLLDRIANMQVGASHSHQRCMECDAPPETVVLWADGRGRAWFCKRCLKRWETEEERDVVRRHQLRDGEDPREFRGRGDAAAGTDDDADEATALETPKKYHNRTGRCPPGHRGNEKKTCIDMKERRKKRRWEQQQKAKERRERARQQGGR